MRTFPKPVNVNELDRAELDWEQQKGITGTWEIFGLEIERNGSQRLLTVLIVSYFIPPSPRAKKTLQDVRIQKLRIWKKNEGGFYFIQ